MYEITEIRTLIASSYDREVKEKTMSASENRIAKIDIIRGLAIILVICGHNIGLVMNGNPYENSAGRFIHDIIYTFHV